MQRLEKLLTDPPNAMEVVRREGESAWGEKLRLYDALRFARLCAYFRHRNPDARITAGMFVFELTASDLEQALQGPPAELNYTFQIKGAEKLSQGQLPFLK
jgi:hypothetical protein